MIIKSMSLENFRSFKNKAKMDFSVNENAPQSNQFGLVGGGCRFSKIASFYGANASGKTSLIHGFNFLKSFISHSFSYSDQSFSNHTPFRTIQDKPSFFEVEFYIEDIFYKLNLEISTERVLSEVLKSRPINGNLTKLYSRHYNPSDKSYSFEGKGLENNFIEKVRSNASIISTARQYNHPELSKVRDHWAGIYNKSREPSFFMNEFDFFDVDDISGFYHEHEDFFLKAKQFLKTADLGLSDIEIETKVREDSRGISRNYFFPYGLHKNKGKTFKIPFPFESGGTQHLYKMLSFIFPALKKGSVCLIDEIENNLHPNLLPAIFDLFTSPETNPKNAQLICTTHMPTLMTELLKYQIFLVEKNTECESEVYRLDEVKGVRSDDNFPRKYLSGTYGGIPDIDT